MRKTIFFLYLFSPLFFLAITTMAEGLKNVKRNGTFRFTFLTGLYAKNLSFVIGGTSYVRSNKPIRVEENCKMKANEAGLFKYKGFPR